MRRALWLWLWMLGPPEGSDPGVDEGRGPAVAPPSRPLDVQSSGCGALDDLEVERLLAIELAGELIPDPQAPAVRVRLHCEAGEVDIAATDPLTATTLARRVPAPAAAEGRERTLALVVSQVMLSSFVEAVSTARADVKAGRLAPAESEPEPEPEPPEPEPEPEPPEPEPPEPEPEPTPGPPPPRTSPWAIEPGLGVTVAELGRDPVPLPAARLELTATAWPWRPVGFTGGAGFEIGQLRTSTGRVRSWNLDASAGVAARWLVPRSPWRLRGALEGSFGVGRIRGLPEPGFDGGAFTGPTGSGRARLGARLRGARAGLGIDLLVGYRSRNPFGEVEGEDDVTPGGPFVGLVVLGTFGP